MMDDSDGSGDDYVENDGDGGVSLEMDDITSPSSALSSSDHNEMIRVYGQTSIAKLDDTSDLWRLPASPIYMKKSRFKSYGITHPIAVHYHQSCRIIRNRWKSDPVSCIPSDLRRQTPYSLAMLSALRGLACSTPSNFALAQSLLLEKWRDRFHSLTIQGEHTNVYIVETLVQDPKPREEKIEENVFGLMLEDVRKARETLSQDTKDVRRDAKQAQKKISRAMVADRVSQRRRGEKEANQGRRRKRRDLDDDLQDMLKSEYASIHNVRHGVSAVPPNSPAITNQRMQPLPPVHAILSESANEATSSGLDEEATSSLSKAERSQLNQTKNLMNKMGIEWSTQSKKTRLKRLRAGGLSRDPNQPVTLPADRVNLNGMPSLYAITPGSSPSGIAQLGQRPLPDQEERMKKS